MSPVDDQSGFAAREAIRGRLVQRDYPRDIRMTRAVLACFSSALGIL